MHVVRKQRVETYLHPDVVAQIEHKDQSMSSFIREAVDEKLENNE